MEIKPVVITGHALLTLNNEFEYLKQNAPINFANKVKDTFVKYIDTLPHDYLLYPECRFLPTQKKIYRNIVWLDYLIVYKLLEQEILVLGIFHSKQNPKKLKSYRRIR